MQGVCQMGVGDRQGREGAYECFGSGPCSSSMWTATEKRFQKAGSRTPAILVESEVEVWMSVRGACALAGGFAPFEAFVFAVEVVGSQMSKDPIRRSGTRQCCRTGARAGCGMWAICRAVLLELRIS